MSVNSKRVIHKNIICSNVFIRKDDKYIMLKRSDLKIDAPGYVQPVGGKLEKDENPFLGAIREVKEEIGIEVKNLRLEAIILEVHPHVDSPYNWLIFYFSADYSSGELLETDEGEVQILSEVEIKNSKLIPSVRSVIDTILNPNDGVVFTTNIYENGVNSIKEISRNVCVIR